jgi:hypothetical protein
LFDGRSWKRLPKLVAEMRWAADLLDEMSSSKVRKVKTDSRNPQVVFALYLAEFIEHDACDGCYSRPGATVLQASHSELTRPVCGKN